MGPTSLTPSPFPAPGKEPESEFLAGEKGSEASARQLKQKFCGEKHQRSRMAGVFITTTHSFRADASLKLWCGSAHFIDA